MFGQPQTWLSFTGDKNTPGSGTAKVILVLLSVIIVTTALLAFRYSNILQSNLAWGTQRLTTKDGEPSSALACDNVSTVSLRTPLVMSEEHVAANRSPAVFTGPHNACMPTKSLQPARHMLACIRRKIH